MVKKTVSIFLAIMLVLICVCASAEGETWICPGCGAENTTKFCTQCATKKPENIVCPKCGTEYPANTTAIFCGECATKLKQDEAIPRYEGEGFDTPEDAALWYFAGLKNQDFEQMLSAFAWESQVEHLDFKAFISRTKGIDPTYVPGMPPVNDLLRSAAVEQIRNEQIHLIYMALVNYVNDEIYNSTTGAIHFATGEEAEEYFRRCDNGKAEQLAAMDNVRFYSSDDITGGRFSNERNIQNYQKLNAKYGADEVSDVVIAVDIGEDTIIAALTAVRYGSRWYLAGKGSQTQLILGIGESCTAFAVVPDDIKESLQSLTPVASATLPGRAETRYCYEGEGFNTPEAAVSYYLEGLKNGDVQQMMRAFAWETQGSRYSLKDYINRVQAISRGNPVQLPALNPFVTEANQGSLRYEQGRMIYYALRSYVMEDADSEFKALTEGRRINLLNDEEVNAFVRQFNNDKAEQLRKMKNIQFYNPAVVIPRYNRESTGRRLEMERLTYGADEAREILAVAEMGGETLVCNPLLMRYGEKWYIVSVSGQAFFFLGIESTRQAFFTVKAPPETLLSEMQR